MFGDDPRFNYKYIVITGITELPQLWRYRLSRLTDPQYVVIEVGARSLKSGYARALKIITIPLTKVQLDTYVYNAPPEDATFDLEGTPIITTFMADPGLE